MNITSIFRYRKNDSPQRKGMRVAVYEGAVAVVITYLLAPPFLTAYLLYLGANSQQIGIVLAIPALANLLQMITAALLQRFPNRKAVYIFFGSIHRVAAVATGAVPFLFPKELWIPVYIAMFGIASVSTSMLNVVWSSLISDMVPEQVRGSYFGFRNIVGGATGSLFMFTMGVVLDRFPGAEGFYIIYAVGIAAAVANIILFTLYPNPKFERSKSASAAGHLSVPFRDGAFLRVLLFLTGWTLLANLAFPFFSYVMLDVLGIGYQAVSTLTILQTFAAMAGYYVWGRLSVRYSTRTLLLRSLPVIAAACLAWGAMAALPAIAVLVAVVILTGFGTGANAQVVFIYVIGETPKADRPAYIGAYYTITGIAGFLGPTAGGAVFEALRDAPLWVQSYGVFLAVGAALLTLALAIGPRVFRGRPAPRGASGSARG